MSVTLFLGFFSSLKYEPMRESYAWECWTREETFLPPPSQPMSRKKLWSSKWKVSFSMVSGRINLKILIKTSAFEVRRTISLPVPPLAMVSKETKIALVSNELIRIKLPLQTRLLSSRFEREYFKWKVLFVCCCFSGKITKLIFFCCFSSFLKNFFSNKNFHFNIFNIKDLLTNGGVKWSNSYGGRQEKTFLFKFLIYSR